MNPDENKNDNQVVGTGPQVPGMESPTQTPTVEAPQPTGVPSFDATGDTPGDSFTTPTATASTSGQPAVPEPSMPTMSDPSAGLPGSSVTPTASSDPLVTPSAQNLGMDSQPAPVTPEPVEVPKAEHSNTLVVILVVVVVLMAVVTAAYFAGLFG